MPQIKLLQQGSILQHTGDYTIGYAISNNDFELMENSFISAEYILNSHPPTADNLSARAMIKGLLESFDSFKTWKKQHVKSLDTVPVPSNVFLNLPNNECMITLETPTDPDKPSQIIEFEILDVIDIAKSLRVAYELVTDMEEFEQVSHIVALLEIFEGFISSCNSKNEIQKGQV